MKPRHEILWLDADAPTDRTMKQVVASSHSRFPVARGSLDNIVGIVKEKDLLARCMGGKPLNLIDMAQPALFVPGAIPAFRLLEMFKKSRTHIALVVNEYGNVQGLVTINDFFEDLVGEVASADEPQERHALQHPDGSWLIDGEMHGANPSLPERLTKAEHCHVPGPEKKQPPNDPPNKNSDSCTFLVQSCLRLTFSK